MIREENTQYFLESDRLKVEIPKPGSFYSLTRFDWDGFITHITLDGRYQFCGTERPGERLPQDGCGLCNEFGIEEPIGFDEAAPGEYFPKIGVGLLKRPDAGPYRFLRPHEFIPYEREISAESGSLVFRVLPMECNGYAVRYEKKLTVRGAGLTLDYRLENTGDKAISTTEYCHDFLAFNDLPVDDGYELIVPFDFGFDRETDERINRQADRVTFGDFKPGEAFYFRFTGFEKKARGLSWTVYNRRLGAGVSESDSFDLCRLPVWGTKHVVSPESFLKIALAPGETKTWRRSYEFFGPEKRPAPVGNI